MEHVEKLRAEFVLAMAEVATPVTVVTSDGVSGRTGVTVSAVASVSADPPMLLACVNRKSPAVAKMEANGRFAVNILPQEASGVAETFAGRPSLGMPYDFTRHAWSEGEIAQPLLEQAVASFECDIAQAIDAGTHRVFIGMVRAVRRNAAVPLVYYQRRFTGITRT